MSILSGLLSPALRVATQAAGAQQQSQAQAADAQSKAIVQRVLQQQQQKDQALKDALTQAQIGNLNSEVTARSAPKPKKYSSPIIGANGEVQVFNENDPTDTQILPGIKGKEQRDPVAPVPHFTIQNVTGADGQIHLAKVNSLTGEVTELPNLGKQPGQGGGGGGASGAQVPVADMEQRYQEIAQHAHDLGAGKWNITRGMQSREGLDYGVTRENAQGKPSLAHMGTSALLRGFDLGGEDYGKYQALMNSTRALGDDVAKVFKGRQNEESVIREVALSELTPDDYNNPDVVEQKLSRLRHIIALAKVNNPAQAGLSNHPAPSSGGAPTPGQLWDRAVQKHGQAKVLQEFGPRPAQ